MDGWASSAAEDLDDPDIPMFAIENCQGEIIGQVGMKVAPAKYSRATATIALFDPAYRNLGIGTEAMRKLLTHGFDRLGLERIAISANGNNSAAIRCYEKAGFVTERVGKDGALHMMACKE